MRSEHQRSLSLHTVYHLIAVFLCLGTLLGCRLSERGRGDRELEPGLQLPNLLREGQLRNAPIGIAAPRDGWIVYAFSPDSSLCERNSRSVEHLASSLSPDWALLSVATDDKALLPLTQRLNVTIPVLTRVPERDLAKYKIDRTPRTYILNQDWKLLEVLDGPYQGQVAERLSRRFNVRLTPPKTDSTVSAGSAQTWDQPQEDFRRLCLDRQQKRYSPGAKVTALGLRLECGPGGLWIPIV